METSVRVLFINTLLFVEPINKFNILCDQVVWSILYSEYAVKINKTLGTNFIYGCTLDQMLFRPGIHFLCFMPICEKYEKYANFVQLLS